jgi:hypothetical protein
VKYLYTEDVEIVEKSDSDEENIEFPAGRYFDNSDRNARYELHEEF